MSRDKYSSGLVIEASGAIVSGSLVVGDNIVCNDATLTNLNSTNLNVNNIEVETTTLKIEKTREIEVPIYAIAKERDYIYTASSSNYDLFSGIAVEDSADASYVSDSFNYLSLAVPLNQDWSFGFSANPYILSGCNLKEIKLTLKQSAAQAGEISVSKITYLKNSSSELNITSTIGSATTLASSNRQVLTIPINEILTNDYNNKIIIETTGVGNQKVMTIFNISFVFSSTDLYKLCGIE